MAPLYLGYAAEGGRISRLLLHHYHEMAKSGAAMIMVENATITANGSGSPRTIRCDHNRYLKGLETLADTIHRGKSRVGLQINHAGRFAYVSESVAPSAVPTFGRTPRALTKREITTIQKQFAKAALRVKKAGFDLVELQGAIKQHPHAVEALRAELLKHVAERVLALHSVLAKHLCSIHGLGAHLP